MNSLNFTIVKRNTPYANNIEASERPKWRHFIIDEEVTMDELKELYDFVGKDLFERGFKSKYVGETVRLDAGCFIGSIVTRITFSCTDTEVNKISAFFVSKGVEAKTIFATFPSKNKK